MIILKTEIIREWADAVVRAVVRNVVLRLAAALTTLESSIMTSNEINTISRG